MTKVSRKKSSMLERRLPRFRTFGRDRMTTRQEKVNSLLLRLISLSLTEHKPEELKGILTITGVEVSPDLENAKVFFSVIGQEPEEVIKILRKEIFKIQRMLNSKLSMRKVPRIVFVADYSGEEAQRIKKLLREIHEDHQT